MHRHVALLFASLLLAATARAEVVLYFSEDDNSAGLYRLDPASGAATSLGESGVDGSTAGLAPSGDPARLYGSEPFGLLDIAVDGGGAIFLSGETSEGLARDPRTGTLYATINGALFVVDPKTGAKIADRATPGVDLEGIAFGNGGVYGLTRDDSMLRFYDPASDGWSTVGDTGVSWTAPGLAFDPVRGLLYAKGDQDSMLYAIEPATGASRVLGDTGIAEGGGLAAVVSRTTLYFSEDSNASGLYRLDPASGAATNLGASSVESLTVALAPSGDPRRLLGSKPQGFLEIAADGGGAVDVGGATLEGLARDPRTGTLYGALNGDFFTVDPADGSQLATLAGPGADVEGIAFGNGGVYGLAGDDGTELRFYDPLGDSWSTVGGTGVAWDLVGLAYDPLTQTLYAKGEGDSNLYEIDPETGTAAAIGDTGIASGGGLAAVVSGSLVGTLYFSEDNNGDGLYRLNELRGTATNLGETGVTGSTVGLAPSANASRLLGSKFAGLLDIAADGSGFIDRGGQNAEGLAYDATTRTLYGAINGAFFTVDPTSGAKIGDLAAPGADVEGLAFANGGVYALSTDDSMLRFYDPASDGWSTLGDTGVSWTAPGLGFDPVRSRLYAKSDPDTTLYEIDPSKGTATSIGDTGIAEGGGLAVAVPEPSRLLLAGGGLGALVLLAYATHRRRPASEAIAGGS